ncbi:MAG: divalent-cation tolerance protein CutA [Balneolia bacterium]|nr:divalent-cation tolerance protein CutA [Balneolia bacterium]
MAQPKAVLVYITTSGPDEARKIAGSLLEENLIACGNILPKMESVYKWKGEVQHDNESVLILKTIEENVSQVEKRVKEMHSYDLPCLVTFPIEGGSSEFLSWIVQESGSSGS